MRVNPNLNKAIASNKFFKKLIFEVHQPRRLNVFFKFVKILLLVLLRRRLANDA